MKLLKRLVFIFLVFIVILNLNVSVSPTTLSDDYITFEADSIDDFVEWVKSGGEKNVGYNSSLIYPGNRRFIESLEEIDTLAIPVLKNNNYYLYFVQITLNSEYRASFRVRDVSCVPKNANTVIVFFSPLSKNEKDKDANEVIQNRLNAFSLIEMEKGELDCPWGEYWIGRNSSALTVGLSTVVYFLTPDHFVGICFYDGKGPSTYSPWLPEFFDYFDFEALPLREPPKVIASENPQITLSSDGTAFRGFSENTTVGTALEYFADSQNLQITNADGIVLAPQDLIATGCVINLLEDEAIADSRLIVIDGDINGDGVITTGDYLLQRSFLKGQTQLTGPFALAADFNNDGAATAADYLLLREYLKTSAT